MMRLTTRVLIVVALCSCEQRPNVLAQSAADSLAIAEAVVSQALLHAKRQASRIDTLIVFRNVVESVPSRSGYDLLARIAASQPIAIDELAPRCAWSGGHPTRGMGLHISTPIIESNSATLEVQLLCMEGATAFAWLFRYYLERAAADWVVHAVEELEIT